MPTKEELEAQVAQLARALENLEGKQELGNSTRATKLEKLDLDELTEEKQSETLEVWIAQAKRDFKRKQQAKPSCKEEDYLLDLIDLARIGKALFYGFIPHTLWQIKSYRKLKKHQTLRDVFSCQNGSLKIGFWNSWLSVRGHASRNVDVV